MLRPRPVRLRDVADTAGVHPATASRALNPATRARVSAATARRVLRAAEDLGYRPNPIARSLKTARSHTVGLVVPDLTNPCFPPLVRGIESVLEPAGHHAWIVDTHHDPRREHAQVDSLRSRQVDGLIVATALRDHPQLRALHADGVPLVLVNRRVDGLDVPCVTPDDASGITQAVAHLAALGHTRVAFVGGPATTSTGAARARAFLHAVRDLGLAEGPALLTEAARWSEAAGARALRALLDAGADCSAVVAANDLLALGCYDAIAERGLRCPADVSVVGFNDMPFLGRLRPALTTVRVPHHEVGAEAARMLLDCVAGPARPARSLLLPVSLVVRASTAPPRADFGRRRSLPPPGTGGGPALTRPWAAPSD
ncbi:HTH-type transcriptional regulator DegA [Streptomyces sp. YIM 121038]|uniref:LacI family DNA-binding transcriptional regulator n=1 Tax=Streptomyces sp. YIM 121038 TaxID=2136401 RepID=UPI001165C809|nr:LacI family DNA-binding transcriptional regulator [Streptomyces sp. YIM 121038]QCX74777.1 HTH-type transcriptional regulator DegA [Streptomyces sp. YIM 121038]